MQTRRSAKTVAIALLALSSSSLAWAVPELVNGYYDSDSDWFVFEWTSPAAGKQRSVLDYGNKIKPKVNASVSLNAQTSTYTYSFNLTNLAGAKQLLDALNISHPAAISDATAPQPQAEWGGADYKGKPVWHWSKTIGAVRGVPAGQTASGFSFKSRGLPGIVEGSCGGERRAEFTSPSDDDPEDIQQSFERVLKRLKAQYPDKTFDLVKMKTVGPVEPPKNFDPASFIQNLTALVNQSRAQAWINNDGIVTSLLAKLANTASKIGSDKATAKNVLGAFMNEVSAQNGKQLTSEAYALLYFNAKYLADRL